MAQRRVSRAALAAWLLSSSVWTPAFAADAARVPELPLSGSLAPAVLPPLARLTVLAGSVPSLSLPSAAPEAAKLAALAARAQELSPAAASAAAIPASAAAPAAVPAAESEASAKALLASAAKTLEGVSAEDIKDMPAERLHGFVAKLLGEYDSLRPASAAAPAAAAPAAALEPDRADEPTRSLVATLRKPAAFLASLGAGYEKIDAARFSREATAIYATPAGAGRTRTLASLRARAASESATEFARLERAVDKADTGSPEKTAVLAAETTALSRVLNLSSDFYRLTPRPAQAYQAELVVEAAERVRALVAALPDSTRRRNSLVSLDRILETHRRLKALTDLNRLTAEGLIRTRVHRPSAAEVARRQRDAGWDADASGRAIADVVVVGAGPAGLATGIHAVAAGLKTVVFEAGYVAQSFSDAAMKPIYRMRTPATRNSLVQAPFSPADLVSSLGMMAKLRRYRARGQLADEELFAAAGRPALGGVRANLGAEDGTVPSARNELLQHFSDVAEEIIRRGGVLRELTGVSRVSKRADGLWEIVAADGSVQLARELVLAQGQVGVQSEFANFGADVEHLALAYPEIFLPLRDRHALIARGAELDALLRAQRPGRATTRRLIVHDALLGAPDVERSLQRLAPGTRVAIVGSGESAVKAAMAVLRQNQTIHVELFTQGELQSNQLQVPAKHVDPEFIGKALNDSKLADECVRQWQEYGVPVTPGTIADLKEQAAAGRLTIHPLGRKLVMGLEGENDEAATVTVRLRRKADGRTYLQLFAADPVMAERLRAAGQGVDDPESKRLLVAEIDGPIVSAVGYSRRALRRDPLTEQLLEQGRVRFKRVPGKSLENEIVLDSEHPLSSALDPDLFIIGAQNYGISADSTIPGAAARAAVTVDFLRKRLRGSPATGAAQALTLQKSLRAAQESKPQAAIRRFTPVVSFLGGLSMIEAALDSRGTVLPGLIDGHYGHGAALALAAVAYNVGGIFGRQAGGVVLSRLGLRRGYALTLGLRAAAFAALGVLLACGLLPLWALLALIGVDGFLYGAAYTAETVAPARLGSQDQHALERISAWQQLLLPLVAFVAPVATGALVSAFGFVPVLAAVPVLFAGAALWFGVTLKLPPAQDRAAAGGRGFFSSIALGARAAFSTPALRTSFAGYILFNVLSPLLYVMIAPLYAIRITHSPEAATAVFGWLAGLYSVGWLISGLVMRHEQKRIAAGAAPAPLLRASVLRWMIWGAVALISLGTFAFSPLTLGAMYALPSGLSWLSALTLPALALIPFGMAQVLASVKLRSFFQSRLTAEASTDGMAFLGAASLAAVTAGILALKFVFSAFAGMTPFAVLAAGLPVLAGIYIWLARRLRRETEAGS